MMISLRCMFMVVIAVSTMASTAPAAFGEVKTVPKTSQIRTEDTAEYAGSTLLNIPLLWKPTETISSFNAIDLTNFQNQSFTLKPFSDLRIKPAEIGRNFEKRGSDRALYVTTRDNVADWLTDRVGRILSEFNVPVVKDGGTISLEADIIKFYVTEESLYKADIGLKIRARSRSGDVVWEGILTVSAKRWGSSYKADNYYEALSNACIDVIYNLLKSESFLQAVKKNK